MSRQKKVVHLTTVHHPLDPRIYYKECLSLHDAGFEVTFIVPEHEDIDPNSSITILPLKKRKNRFKRMFLSTMEAYKKARDLKADYYHIHDPELLPVAWLLKKKGNVVIYDIHEDYETAMLQKEYLIKPLRYVAAKMYRLIEKFFSRKLELCLAEKYYKEKYPRGTCILNYPVLNEKLMKHEITEEPAENKLIYTGNVTMERGAMEHAKLPYIDNSLSVYFFGKCPSLFAAKMYETAGERRNQLIIEGIDRFVPKGIIEENYVSHRWLAGVALFPPSEHYMKKELTKFFEYMSAGIPIICSDFPKWKEFVEEYACGIAVDPHNDAEIKGALDYLRENGNAAKKMGKNGKEAILHKLNWKIEEKKLVEWYDEMWQNKSS
ncbi:glycosyltransferase [Evansella sp. AB-P1]|uniref:glycosyltransferase n=1 Tax=Evansella sp. AB-P1 TaxID=3037653 RepID=UPI00241F4516|nr:glycosyltransferase [Evansella sp. AB-P1]MDG5786703.1 glycosyltransferase [Evansella sp. AB-P1]